jgi:hypothetical protein
MFLGHFGVGFGAKRFAPRASLGTLFLAAQFADLLWPTLLLLGVERVRIAPGITRVTPLDFVSYPISHSLAMIALWGLVFAAVYWAARRYARGALVVGLAVLSHWVLDLLVHRPDLPLTPAERIKVGLDAWASVPATVALEFGLLAVGCALYLQRTAARDRAGAIGPWALVLLLAAIYVANLAGPPPPSATAVAWAGEAQWLLVLFAYWLDRHRMPLGTD